MLPRRPLCGFARRKRQQSASSYAIVSGSEAVEASRSKQSLHNFVPTRSRTNRIEDRMTGYPLPHFGTNGSEQSGIDFEVSLEK